jgi:hypothetical protein
VLHSPSARLKSRVRRCVGGAMRFDIPAADRAPAD